MAWEIAVLTSAIATSGLAAVLPWLRRDELPADAWERRTAFVILVGDAFYAWWAFAHAGAEVGDPTWLASLSVLMVAGMAYAIFIGLRGHELPPAFRWPLVGVLGVAEPIVLILSFTAVHGPIPLW